MRPDRVVGALVVRRKSTGAFSEETCELLAAFASQSAVALTNARLYQQLEQQSVALAEASRHKSEFLASMSHELRTPLNAVIGFSEVLLERMFGDLNERQEDYLEDIHSAGRHLLALLGDILDLSKIEAGRMELDLTTFPIDDILVQALSLVRERAALHGIRLTLEAAEGLGLVTADELRLKQVLLNLLSNAVKFTPDGGSIVVRAWRDGEELDVTVTDTGIGIAPADQERIFDSFQQGERSASSSEGTGLGLTLSRRIVELHGGRLWLTSTPGEGSTFGISVPQPDADRSAGGDVWMLDEGPADGPTVVVIEDDPRSAELVELHLRAAGLRPVAASTGEQGLDLVRARDPVAVVLDIHLPGMDGWEVLSELKSDPATAHVPVVVVSVEPERGRGFALGATEYLVKPVSGEHLLAAVTRLLPPPHADEQSPRLACRRRRRRPPRPQARAQHARAAGLGGAHVRGRSAGGGPRARGRPVRRRHRPAHAPRRRLRRHRRAAAPPRLRRAADRRAHREVLDTTGPLASRGAHRVRRREGRHRPAGARAPARDGRRRARGEGEGP